MLRNLQNRHRNKRGELFTLNKNGLPLPVLGHLAAIFFSSLALTVSLPITRDAAAIREAYLTVIVNVTNDNGGTARASDITVKVSSPDNDVDIDPSSFHGSESGTNVVLFVGCQNEES
jgi:hypothetical protein